MRRRRSAELHRMTCEEVLDNAPRRNGTTDSLQRSAGDKQYSASSEDGLVVSASEQFRKCLSIRCTGAQIDNAWNGEDEKSCFV